MKNKILTLLTLAMMGFGGYVGYTTNYPIISQPNLEKLEEISKISNIELYILSVTRYSNGLEQKNYWIDKVAPTKPSITNPSGGNWTNQNVTVKAYGMKDPLSNGVSSGLSVYKWKDVSGWYSYGTYNFYTHSNINDQTNGYALVSWDSEINFTFQVVVCDNAGNCTNASSTTNIKIDKTAPGGTMSISNTSGGNWTNQPVTITASGIVEQGQSYLQSGMRHYRYSYDGTNWYP